MSAIDEVKQRTDIIEVIGQYATLKKAGRNLTALCPFHSEKNPSFFVYPEQQSWHCFGACNTGGDVFSFVMKKEGLDFGEALRMLAQRAGVTLPSRTAQEDRREEKEGLYQVNEAAALYFNNLLLNSPAAEKARSYVEKRGFTPKTIADSQLGFSLDSWEALKQYLMDKGYSESDMLTAGLLIEAENGKTHDRFRGKLMFPIRDIRGHVTGFGARVLDDSLPKYINSPQTPTFDKSGTLYGIDRAAAEIRKQDTAIVMEGYMDVITAHQNGITNVVASMGTAVTETQVNMLKKLTKNLLLAFDADIAGVEASQRGGSTATTPTKEEIEASKKINDDVPLFINETNVRNYLKYGTRYLSTTLFDNDVNIIVLPKGKDPDDIIREDINAWQEIVSKAKSFVDYTFDLVTSEIDMNTDKGKSQVVERLLPIVDQISEPVRRALYIQKLANTVGITRRDLEAALSQIKPPPVRRRAPTTGPSAAARALRPLAPSPLEADCLALLLQHPELKASPEGVLPEYVENSANHEIFVAWHQVENLSSLRENLDESLYEHLDYLINKSLPSTNIEQRYADYVRRLQQRYLKNRAARIAEIFAFEAEAGATDVDLTRLEEEGLEISHQLRELDARKNKRRPQVRR